MIEPVSQLPGPVELPSDQSRMLGALNQTLLELLKTQEVLARQLAAQHQASFLRREVYVTNVNMPFWAMVGFMIKWVLASIPAMLVLTIVIGAISALVFFLLALFGGTLAAIFSAIQGGN